MSTLVKTTSNNQDFIALVKELDEYLEICDGDEHDFYDQFNKLDQLNHVIVLYIDSKPVGCGAFKKHSPGVAEIKRMYVQPDFRNKGFAGKILSSLEAWAKELTFQRVVLETGKRQFEAVAFYKKSGYWIIENFPPYTEMENSICFQKTL